MSLDRNDFYDECKSYIIYSDWLEWFDDLLFNAQFLTDMDIKTIENMRNNCITNMEMIEKRRCGRVLNDGELR